VSSSSDGKSGKSENGESESKTHNSKTKLPKASPAKVYLKSMLEQCHATIKMKRLENLNNIAKHSRITKNTENKGYFSKLKSQIKDAKNDTKLKTKNVEVTGHELKSQIVTTPITIF
jgi:hypothetical protein